ncbi:cation:proton antiporter [Rhodococcus sp. X156]|uniref:cation:proton antiporter domain-containing protein n=1 Tax=Rhodococcus sp. X156 TaxID=2499145 RepID=UPI0019CFA55A|nr:cation:proton antiporter [Rhodococcus sp. X156]
MTGLDVTVVLGASVLAGAVLAPRLRVPAPLFLVILGLLLGFVPRLRQIELPPEVMLLLFLPVMLFWESLTTSLRSIRRDLRGIVLMSTLAVVATAFGWPASPPPWACPGPVRSSSEPRSPHPMPPPWPRWGAPCRVVTSRFSRRRA